VERQRRDPEYVISARDIVSDTPYIGAIFIDNAIYGTVSFITYFTRNKYSYNIDKWGECTGKYPEAPKCG
jgi:hypothetical protein